MNMSYQESYIWKNGNTLCLGLTSKVGVIQLQSSIVAEAHTEHQSLKVKILFEKIFCFLRTLPSWIIFFTHVCHSRLSTSFLLQKLHCINPRVFTFCVILFERWLESHEVHWEVLINDCWLWIRSSIRYLNGVVKITGSYRNIILV